MAQQSAGLDREQRLCLALHLSMDDLQPRLKQLAAEGRVEDCSALIHELGDWLALGCGEVAPLLYATIADQQP